jgi:hypothetical protein
MDYVNDIVEKYLSLTETNLKLDEKFYNQVLHVMLSFRDSYNYTRLSLMDLEEVILSIDDFGREDLGILKAEIKANFRHNQNPLDDVDMVIFEVSTKGLSDFVISFLYSIHYPILLRVVQVDDNYTNNCLLDSCFYYEFSIDGRKLCWSDEKYSIKYKSDLDVIFNSGVHYLSRISLECQFAEDSQITSARTLYESTAAILCRLDNSCVAKEVILETMRLRTPNIKEYLMCLYLHIKTYQFNYIDRINVCVGELNKENQAILWTLSKLPNCIVTNYRGNKIL